MTVNNEEKTNLGYVIEVINENNPELNFYLQNVTFKFNSSKRELTQFGYSKIRKPTTKTKENSYIYELEEAEMILNILKVYGKKGKLKQAFKVNKPKEKILIENL